MRRFSLLTVAVVLCLGHGTADAQMLSGSAFVAGVGINQSVQRITAASPYRYAGHGPEVMLAYRRRTAASGMSLAFTGASATMSSGLTLHDYPRERVLASAIALHYDRAAGGFLAARWRLGADASLRAEIVEHQHSAAENADFYDFAALQLGPVIEGTWSPHDRRISTQLSLPVVSAVNFPWSNTQSGTASFTLVSPATTRAVENVLRFQRHSGARETWSYRMTYLDHVGGQGYRVIRQSLSLAVALRQWGASP